MYSLFAHVKWFVGPESVAVRPLSGNEWVAACALTALGLLLLIAVHAWLSKIGVNAALDRKLSPYGRFVPLIVRYTTGLLLVINAAKGLLFAPNVPTTVYEYGGIMSVLLGVAGVMLIIGLKVRWAAAAILAVYGFALLVIHPVINVLDHVEYLGIGLYLLLYGDSHYVRRAAGSAFAQYLTPASLLRVFVGLGLMVLALSEKLVGIANSTYFLGQYSWNLLQFMGVSDRNFIIIAGVTELVVGLTLVLNIAPRLTTLIVALLMTATAVALGVEEVFGHLFALSLVAVVWLNPDKFGITPPRPAKSKTGKPKAASSR